MLRLILFALFAAFCEQAFCADARVITENGTNILAIGIDTRDYDVIRFYLRGSNVIEFRADDIIHLDRKVLGAPISQARIAERDAILAAIVSQTNFSGAQAIMVISNLARLKVIESLDDAGRPRLAKP